MRVSNKRNADDGYIHRRIDGTLHLATAAGEKKLSGLCIHKLISVGEQQTRHTFALHKMLFDNFIDVVLIDIGVPDPFRVDHQHRTEFAAIEATGLIDAGLTRAIEVKFPNALFGIFLNGTSTAITAAGAAIVALVQTEKT